MGEKRTMADIRREKFNKQGQIARELADLALQEIDEALQEHATVRRPGEIGAVVVFPSFALELPEPPDAA